MGKVPHNTMKCSLVAYTGIPINVYKLLALEKNTCFYMTVCKQIIIDK